MFSMGNINLTVNISITIDKEFDITTISKAIAQTLSRAVDESMQQGNTSQSNITLIEFMKDTMKTEQISPSTMKNKLSTLKWIDTLFPKITLAELDTSFIALFTNNLRKKEVSTNTIIKHIRHLRFYLFRAVKAGLIGQQWLDSSLYYLKHDAYRHSFLSSAELHRFENLNLQLLSKTQRNVALVFLFCCYTGLRFSDVTRITWDNLHRQGRDLWLQVTMKKTRQLLEIPISRLFNNKVADILGQLPTRNMPNQRLFPFNDNSYINKVLKKLCQQCHIQKDVTFHTARHTFGTQCLYHGIKMEIIQGLLGHSSIKTTQGYAEMTHSTMLNGLKKVKW